MFSPSPHFLHHSSHLKKQFIQSPHHFSSLPIDHAYLIPFFGKSPKHSIPPSVTLSHSTSPCIHTLQASKRAKSIPMKQTRMRASRLNPRHGGNNPETEQNRKCPMFATLQSPPPLRSNDLFAIRTNSFTHQFSLIFISSCSGVYPHHSSESNLFFFSFLTSPFPYTPYLYSKSLLLS